MVRSLPRLALAGGLVLSTFAARGAEPSGVFEPAPPRDGAARLEGDTWIEDGPGYAVRLRHLDQEQRLAFLRASSPAATDPFASPPDRPPGFLTFLLEVENRGSGSVELQARMCWLVTNRNDVLQPIGMDTLEAGYGLIGSRLPAAYAHVGPAVLAGSRTIGPSQSVSGLLVYRMVPPKTKGFGVDVQFTLSSGDVIRLSAPYRRAKKSGNAR